MPLSPANTIIFFALIFIAFSLVLLIDDIRQERARKRRDARRRRIAAIESYGHYTRPRGKAGA